MGKMTIFGQNRFSPLTGAREEIDFLQLPRPLPFPILHICAKFQLSSCSLSAWRAVGPIFL